MARIVLDQEGRMVIEPSTSDEARNLALLSERHTIVRVTTSGVGQAIASHQGPLPSQTPDC